MADIQIKDLWMVFGTPKQVEKAFELEEKGLSVKEIREKSGATIGIKNINLDIKDGELFVIVGLSGSGKSTLIRCLNRLNRPTRGDVLFDGTSIMGFDKEELRAFRRKRVSMVFQHFGLLSHRTIIDNVAYGLEIQDVERKERHERAMEAIRVVGLEGWENMKPHQLSGGMKQRVGLARAIVTEPDILLMDEPYSALDPLIRREMQNELLGLEDYINRTIVFITHDMNEAFKMGDRIALMKDAEIVQVGAPQDFFEKPANDYVRDFIADVDKTIILKARNIMTKADYLARADQSPKEVHDQLESLGFDYCFVVDKDKKYLGRVQRTDLEKSSDDTIESAIEELEPILRNTYIKGIWGKFENGDPVFPVVDQKGRFRGIISKDIMISALA
ncbi:MAG: glycine betaine/L-proline ABC transporter ATP-binding protein [Acholeplasmataceae bacterium]